MKFTLPWQVYIYLERSDRYERPRTVASRGKRPDDPAKPSDDEQRLRRRRPADLIARGRAQPRSMRL